MTFRPPEKIVIAGHSRHGKDTVCNLVNKIYGFSSISSSFFAAPYIYPKLQKKFGYSTIQQAHEDRNNHQKEWFDLIVELNTPDLTFLGTKLFEKYLIYNGLRNRDELLALREKFPGLIVVWVDASERKAKQNNDSCSVTRTDASIIIDNNGSEEQLERNVEEVFDRLMGLNQNRGRW